MEANAAALLENLDTITRAGVDALVLFGSTGEFVHFDIEERARVLSLAIRRSRVPMLVNVSHSSFHGAVALAEQAIEAGASGLLLMPPYFYRYTEDQIFDFYQAFVQEIKDYPALYLYNLPAFTNPITLALATRLLETKSFAGIKDSSGDAFLFAGFAELKKALPFQLLAGNESLYTQVRANAADGIISGVAAAVPELMVALDRAIVSQVQTNVEALSPLLSEFLEWIAKFPACVAIRRAASLRGWPFKESAVPPGPAMQKQFDAYDLWFQAWIPDVLKQCSM